MSRDNKVDGPSRFQKTALDLLCEGEYKGNVRHLIDVVERAYLLARAAGRQEICVDDLPALPVTMRYERQGDRDANEKIVERPCCR